MRDNESSRPTWRFYGGMIVFFAAKDFVEKRAMKRGRQAERERIQRELAKHGAPLAPEQVRILSTETGNVEG